MPLGEAEPLESAGSGRVAPFRFALGGVNEAVEQMGLPPVMPLAPRKLKAPMGILHPRKPRAPDTEGLMPER